MRNQTDMRTSLFVLVVLAAALSASLAAASTSVLQRPALRLVSRTPVVVAGTHFRSRERVTVTVRTPDSTTRKTLSASPSGTFRVAFPTVDAPSDPCALFAVIAAGRNGSTARLHVMKPVLPGIHSCPAP